MARASRLTLLIALAIVAGCVQPNPDHPPEGAHEPAPMVGVGAMSLDANGFLVHYVAPGAPEADELVWPMTRNASWDEGLFTLPAVMTNDGTQLFAFTLRLRLDEPHPLQLAFNESLALTNTFNFSFFEHASWAGRDANLTRVVNVSNESWLDVYTWERHKARLTGDFHFAFDAASEDGAVTERIVLEGSFPIPRRH